MSLLVTFLILFPLLAGAALLLTKASRLRDAIAIGAGAVIAAAAVAAAVQFGNGATLFFGPAFDLPPGPTLFWTEAALSFGLARLCLRYRRFDSLALLLGQLGFSFWMERTGHEPAANAARLFSFDRLSMLMVLVVGIIGPLICLHALGFMRDFHRRQPLLAGRRPVFFCLIFVFLSAMFGLVTANHLPLLHLFWELTTACSFLLIGYTRTEQTIGYAFGALRINLVGGIAFSVAIALLGHVDGGLDLARLTSGPAAAALLPALALLALAGLTKSAQMPFSSWLLGAMYAPAPTSALLHSSTMVKAGVFLLLRLAPAIAGSSVGTAVALVGLFSFLFSSLIACTEQNAKRVLAWSTIGNLGLVVACAGVATPATLWVGAMIIVFHAVAKSLLFLVVGTLENRLYTKDLESFDNLLSRFPRVSLLALVGVSGMFLAPFGMVLAKWSAIRAFLEVPGWRGAVYVTAMAYGSACTIYYWAKLLLKILAIRRIADDELAIEGRVSRSEWFAEGAHAALVVALALSVGLLSQRVVSPWALGVFGEAPRTLLYLSPWVVALLAFCVLALPLLALRASRAGRYDLADIYVSGRTADEWHRVASARGVPVPVRLRNYYLTGVFNGPRIFRAGTAACGAVLFAAFLLQAVRR